MQEQNKMLFKNPTNRFREYETYNQKLHAITLFPINNNTVKGGFFRTILNFNFKDINFNKKKAPQFFLALELLTNQKCVATLSSKNILAWKLRKGMLAGCKTTLRSKNLEDFFDNLFLTLPRMEKFQPVLVEKIKNNNISLKLNELIFFYPIELGLGINSEIKKLDINFIFKTFSKEEKIFLLTSKKIPVV